MGATIKKQLKNPEDAKKLKKIFKRLDSIFFFLKLTPFFFYFSICSDSIRIKMGALIGRNG